MTLSSSQEVAVVIGFWACNGPCNETDVSQIMGNVVYNGPYSPQLVDPGFKPPYQNFTVTVPSHFVPGSEVSLNVAHFTLIGVRLPFACIISCSMADTGSALGWARAIHGDSERHTQRRFGIRCRLWVEQCKKSTELTRTDLGPSGHCNTDLRTLGLLLCTH